MACFRVVAYMGVVERVMNIAGGEKWGRPGNESELRG